MRLFTVDAFAEAPFTGNPAAVCLLEGSVDDAWMQAVAAEMNLSETAFVVEEAKGWGLRWMTPTVEVDLCGHATLATAHVLFTELDATSPLRFQSRSGTLEAARLEDGRIALDFPATVPQEVAAPAGLLEALGLKEAAFVGKSRFDYLVEVGSRQVVADLRVDLRALAGLDVRGVMVTAADDAVDFVSRFFAPAAGVDEDPVTGSAHCALAPYWTAKLGRAGELRARQLSKRGGRIDVELAGDRVKLRGRAITTMRGELLV